MRFLADENVPAAAVAALEQAGYDVVWIRRIAPGSSDRDVLARAIAESRVLLTFDKDFGELSRRAGLPRAFGVILFRIPLSPPFEIGRRLLQFVESRNDWEGHFSVVEPARIRMRALRVE
jgi:predicted nuclease of predicted toxin-antitoxin system